MAGFVFRRFGWLPIAPDPQGVGARELGLAQPPDERKPRLVGWATLGTLLLLTATIGAVAVGAAIATLIWVLDA